jgi:N-acetylglucosaminyldiphosphoundecaprenol N-acetyl-beta-D-mannosaminyltransferase
MACGAAHRGKADVRFIYSNGMPFAKSHNSQFLTIETNSTMNTTLEANKMDSAGCARTYRTNVLGVGISVVNMDDAVKLSESMIRSHNKGYVCVTDVHGIIEAQSDSEFRDVLNGSAMTTPDGMPLVWVGRIQGHKRIRRVYGPDYLLEMCRVSVKQGYRHFFFGGKPGVAESLALQLSKRFPGLQIAGTYTPPFRPLNPAEEEMLEELVARTKPDVFWVGLGSPKQERFMARYCGRLETKLMVGIGAAFDIHSGNVKEAPKWLKAAGLQWLHRLIQEPRRLSKRYLNCIPNFLWMIGLQLTGMRRSKLEA